MIQSPREEDTIVGSGDCYSKVIDEEQSMFEVQKYTHNTSINEPTVTDTVTSANMLPSARARSIKKQRPT